MIDNQALQIASGVLIAFCVLYLVRIIGILWVREDYGLAALIAVMVAQVGGGLILAGFGFVTM